MARYADFVVDAFMKLESSDNNDFASFSELNDPTYLEFLVIPHFESQSGLLASEDHKNSALAYLKRIGETERYKLLKQFIKQYDAMNQKCMWQYKSISGIDEAMNHQMNAPLYDKDSKLTFEMYETIDWRMQSLMSLYKSIAFDTTHRFCEILPANLRRFWMTIYVRDIRILFNDPEGKNLRDFGRTIDHLDVELTSCNHKMFHFGHCEFDITSGTKQYSSLSSVDITEAEFEIIIKYRTFSESSVFRTILGDVEVSSIARNIPKSWLQNQVDIANTGIDKIGEKSGINLDYAFQPFENQAKSVDKTLSDLQGGADSTYSQRLQKNVGDATEMALGNVANAAINRAKTALTPPRNLGNVYSDSDFFKNLDLQVTNLLGKNINFKPLT